ncbi:MAG: type II toxin-antitoxin system MqsR family toxin [Chlorobium sp.]|jgi:motility quorum-sensing regulator/GCU-specific mRNA interferase toxin|nr:MAG: type II toxin-antitoxin system MqsR family toxin [Chlorobium sp.]
MEKRTPHYKLEKIKKTVADNNSRPFTMTALRGGLELGLTEPLMREVVLKLTRDDFYKSMTTHSDHRLWQDVYQGKTPDNIPVYIKITDFNDARPLVIQFKAK